MLGKRKKQEIIDTSYNIEKNKENVSPEQGREISDAIRSYTFAAQYFEKHIAEEEKAKTKRANRLSIFLGVITFMSVGAVLLLTPLKTVVPFVIRVDNNSGYTDIVQAGADKYTDQTDDSYWSVLYVTQRESYNFSTQDMREKFVELSSYNNIFNEYKTFQLSKKGYMAVLGDKQQIRVNIRNVSKPQESTDKTTKTIQIRFDKSVLDDVGQPVASIPTTTWMATISFDYGRLPKNRLDEWINPKGYGVRSYELSQEIGYQ